MTTNTDLALSFNSDLFTSFRPFSGQITKLTPDELQELLFSPVIRTPHELYEHHKHNQVFSHFLCESNTAPAGVRLKDRRGEDEIRGNYLASLLEVATSANSTSIYPTSSASEQFETQHWYKAMFSCVAYVSSIIPGLCINQNVVDSSITKKGLNQDFNMWYQNQLLVAGKWKRYTDKEKTVAVPEKELLTKTLQLDKSMYGDLQYIIGIAAANDIATVYHFDLVEHKLVSVADINLTDDVNSKLGAFIMGWNILRWIHTLSFQLPQFHPTSFSHISCFDPEKEAMTLLSLQDNYYKKVFTLPVAHQAAWLNVYKKLQGLPHMAIYVVCINDHIIDLANFTFPDNEDVRVTLEVRPVGIQKVVIRPNEMLILVRSLLQFLVAFHRLGLVHRDLRMQNIIWITEQSGATTIRVIDPENADVSERLIFWKGQPQYFTTDVQNRQRTYNFMDDMFQVGTTIGRYLLLRNPDHWLQTEVDAWDKFADLLRSRTVSAQDALSFAQQPEFPVVVLPVAPREHVVEIQPKNVRQLLANVPNCKNK